MSRRILALIVAAATLPVVFSSSSAAAGGTFTFYGSGYGHGLGLSQWGAYGLAVYGWKHQNILGHFYQSTKLGPAPSAPRSLRIGLMDEWWRAHLTATHGPVALRIGSLRGKLIGGRPIQAAETWRVMVDPSGKYRVLDNAGKLAGDCPSCRGHLWGGTNQHIFATYAGSGMVWLRQSRHTYNRGYIEFNLYPSGSCPNLSYCERIIIVLRPQPYLYGLAEVPSGWPMEALAAQADAARTYAFEKVARIGQHRDPCNCALHDDTRDQVYAGWDKEGGPQGDRWVAAVDKTNGEVVLYNGAPIQAYYFSSSGGFTENNENVWGGTPLPYLRGVCDPGDYTPQNPSAVWTVGPLSDTTLADALRPYTGYIGRRVVNFTNYVRGVSGRIVSVTVVGGKGQATISGWMLRSGLALKDDRVWINANRQVTGDIRGRYDQLMCAPGLPTSRQWSVAGGAVQRFVDGAIYWNAARAASYWERGPILDKYKALGESGGLLGMPRSEVIALHPSGCAGKACAMVRFEQGNIYFKEGIGDGSPHELHGFVLDYYLNLKPPEFDSHLGFPVTDVNKNPDGSTWAKFEDGTTVTCSPDGKTCTESNGPADLSVRISAPYAGRVGGKMSFVLSVRNAGPSRARSLVVTDVLPRAVTLLSAKPSQGTCRGRATVTCSLGALRRGATATIRLLVRLRGGGGLRDVAHVGAKERDPRRSNNSAIESSLACTIIGTPGADSLRGTNGPDVICGLGGNDTIYGYGGNDLIFAGAGDDVVYAGSGNDTIYGGPGNDRLFGGPGTDACRQGPGTGPRVSCES